MHEISNNVTNTREPHIRYAKRGDIYDIAVFLDACWRAEYRQIIAQDYLDKMSVDERHQRLLEGYLVGGKEFLMMQDKDTLIGASVFGQSDAEGYERDGEIHAIYLKHEYIGKGYGHRLFIETEQALIAKGHSHIVLDLLEGNTRALHFYLAHGYEKLAYRTIQLGERDYLLVVLRKNVEKQSSPLSFG